MEGSNFVTYQQIFPIGSQYIYIFTGDLCINLREQSRE